MPELAELVSVDVADVYKGSELAGQLRRAGSQVGFHYLDDYVGPDLATSLPVGAEAPGGPPGAVPPFFAGLLPEGRRLRLLQQAVKSSADDELTQLLAVGGDTVGDVTVVPTGQPRRSPAPRFDAADLDSGDKVRFGDLLHASVGDLDRIALPGVQPKVSARMQTIPIRTGGPLSDAILKLEPDDLPRLVANEARCLVLARDARLAVPDHRELVDADGRPALLVRRFDRVEVDGDLRALPQEDGCQVLGLWPADKYRPSTERLVSGLAAVCGAPTVAALRLWEQVAFSYLVANGDLHAKNLSVRRTARGWEPTPVYDVICTFPYGDTLTMALPLGGDRNPDRVSRARLLDAGERTGVPSAALAHRLELLLQRTERLPTQLAELSVPGVAPAKLRRVLERRRERLTA